MYIRLSQSADVQYSSHSNDLARHKNHLEDLVNERTRELKNTQEKLIRKGRLATLGQLIATVSHELCNPLASMRSSFYFIRKRIGLEDDQLAQAIERIDRNVMRCDNIIDELLYFTHASQSWRLLSSMTG